MYRRRLLARAIGAGLSLSLLAAPTLAQDAPIVINADGDNSGAGRGTIANNDGGDIYLGDISSLPPGTVIDVSNDAGPSQTVSGATDGAAASRDRTQGRAPSDSAGDTGGEVAPTPSEGDGDGDNYQDALEPDAGLDPENPDTDEDGVADGDEVNVFDTDPLQFDTDGDGYGDGEELFWTDSDPLDRENRSGISNESTRQSTERSPEDEITSEQQIETDSGAADSPEPPPPARGQGSDATDGDTGSISASSGGATTLGDGGASAAPGDITREGEPAAPLACGDFTTWYDAQTAYEDAGAIDAPDALIDSIDRDRDGIACESMMETGA